MLTEAYSVFESQEDMVCIDWTVDTTTNLPVHSMDAVAWLVLGWPIDLVKIISCFVDCSWSCLDSKQNQLRWLCRGNLV